MTEHERRTFLKLVGATALAGGASSTAAAYGRTADGDLRKRGHSLLSDPAGGYTEEDVRADGRYAVVGSFFGTGGSFLVDLSDPADPTEVHRLESGSDVRNADVAFDRRDGLYYRSQEPNAEDATLAGVEVVDYGYADGSVDDPQVLSSLEAGPTHNVHPHPEADVLYTTNEPEKPAGLGVWDVSDPAAPERVGYFGPNGDLHDMVVDPANGHLHCAFIGGGDFEGYAILDVSDPLSPELLGSFDYSTRPDYETIGLQALKRDAVAAFESCHYATYDPNRDLAYVGDEIASGVPGGKHVFDVSDPANPKHRGFTLSPDAELMDEGHELYDWTGHNFDVVPRGDTTYLVSGDYHEGTVLYDVTNPNQPEPVDSYATDDMADEANGPGWLGAAPMAWGADYNATRDLVVTSDMATGVYVFDVSE